MPQYMKKEDRFPMFDFLDRPVPEWMDVSKIIEKHRKKHHPIKYMTQQYVESVTNNPEQTNWTEVSNTLCKLSTAEKNYSANDPKPKIFTKFLSIAGSIFGIACITQPEKFDTFVSKAWPFVYKDRDQD